MALITQDTSLKLWQEAVREAEQLCKVSLNNQLETYLVSLLIRHTNCPEILKKILATSFLEALDLPMHERAFSLQRVGDQCLLLAGLFPKIAEKKHVKLSYFVDLGRSAYATISLQARDLYWSLACQFVALMDVLQSIRGNDMLPLEAYDQWQSVGSKRALKILESYSQFSSSGN